MFPQVPDLVFARRLQMRWMRKGKVKIHCVIVEVDVHDGSVGRVVNVTTIPITLSVYLLRLMEVCHVPPVLSWEIGIPGSVWILTPEEWNKGVGNTLILINRNYFWVEQDINWIIRQSRELLNMSESLISKIPSSNHHSRLSLSTRAIWPKPMPWSDFFVPPEWDLHFRFQACLPNGRNMADLRIVLKYGS